VQEAAIQSIYLPLLDPQLVVRAPPPPPLLLLLLLLLLMLLLLRDLRDPLPPPR
jgi:hypothetical protein